MVFDLDDTLVVETGVAASSMRQALAAISDAVTATAVGDSSPEVPAEEWILSVARRAWRSGPHLERRQQLGISSWEGLWASLDGCHPSLEELRTWLPVYRHEAWGRALGALGVTDTRVVTTAMAAYRAAQRRGHQPVAGATNVLDRLSGRSLGLLTNGPPDVQRAKLEGAGLAGCFGAVVISGEIGVGKPDPAAFTEVLGRLGVPAASAVMVGDNWRR